MESADMQPEKFKDIPGYEGLYQANQNGEIFSLIKNMVMKQRVHKCGYMMVGLTKNNKQRVVLVHKLICMTFVGEALPGFCVHHKNHDKKDNRLSNLEYMNRSLHAAMHVKETHALGKIKGSFKTRLYRKGMSANKGAMNGRAKLNDEKVLEIRKMIASHIKVKDIAKMYHVNTSAIYDIKNGKKWTHVTGGN